MDHSGLITLVDELGANWVGMNFSACGTTHLVTAPWNLVCKICTHVGPLVSALAGEA